MIERRNAMRAIAGRLFAGGVAVAVVLVAGAHTTIEQAVPASGAVLEQSPATIELKFKHAVRMTSVIVLDAAKAERKVTFEPTTRTQVVAIISPNLGPGRSELRWKALSEDGHVISGSLSYVVKPAGANP
jgi:methionine-rich copper-binding protein CopC